MTSGKRTLGAILLLGAVLSWTQSRSETRRTPSCETLAATHLNGASIESAIQVAAGAGIVSGEALTGLPAFCRIRGLATPTSRSRIHFEVWLPLSGWSGRIEMLGNGGYSPQIHFSELAALIRTGDAAVATDTGHEGEGLDFGFDNQEAIADWGHRAVHESIQAAKVIVARFYGRAADHSYFAGCSTGGHQALMEAQRYPADFDGLLAGDPGNNRTNLNFGFLWQFLANHPSGDNAKPVLTVEDLKSVSRAVTAQCDALDGVKDGVITDPRQCKFDPASLRCAPGQSVQCLADDKIAALRKMYAGARRSDTGQSIYPGWPVGSEYVEGAGGWYVYWANPQKPDEPQRVDYFRRWAFNEPGWDWYKFDWSKGVDAARRKLESAIDATSDDLSAFQAGGGKLLIYQGSADPVVSATDTIAYYQRLEQNNPNVSRFARLFLVPGMAHCTGGPGATNFTSGTDADHDAGLALRRWVEQGKAPERIIASRYIAKTPESGIAMTRPLCAWPKAPVYKGTGDTNDAANFVCR